MPYTANYPRTAAEVLDDSMTFNPAALRAVKKLARAKPWRAAEPQRLALFTTAAAELSAAYGIRTPSVRAGRLDGSSSGDSNYSPAAHAITLNGRLSVVTFLHEFAHARGYDERKACRWSLNIFRRCFPRSFARCRQVGHVLVADRTQSPR